MIPWSSPFPESVAFVVLDDAVLSYDAAQPTEQQLLGPRVVEERRREFILGRIAARRAIEALGETPQPILKGRHRQPLWPEGLLGAITHTRGMAAVAVAPCSLTEGIGLDIEDSRGVRDGVEPMVADAVERRWTRGDPLRVAMVFSAKETLFKAFYRLRREYFGFEAARLQWRGEGFEATLRESMGPHHSAGSTVEIGCVRSGPFVMTSLMLPPSAR